MFGLLESLAGVGAVAGAIVGLRWRPRYPLRIGMLLVLAWPLTDLLFALTAPLPVVSVTRSRSGSASRC